MRPIAGMSFYMNCGLGIFAINSDFVVVALIQGDKHHHAKKVELYNNEEGILVFEYQNEEYFLDEFMIIDR